MPKSEDHLNEWLDYIYNEVKTFDLAKGLRCQLPGLWRCCAVFKTGELSIVYVKSNNRKDVQGCVICSDSFAGTRGDITDDELEWVRKLHTDIVIPAKTL